MSELMGNRSRHSLPEDAPPPGALRTGYTTGACATAAARAATRALATGQAITEVIIDLPAKKGVTFAICRCKMEAERVRCGVIKDAGDDPDVTHGAEIQATVEWDHRPGIILTNGPGVGRVTKPGLAVEVGEPAINPTPRRMITQAVLAEADTSLGSRGLKVTISVPNGENIAQETLNPRLGIIGGISILGTTGIVRPFSRSAYRGSIFVELKVAAHNHVPRAVLTTGHRSEQYTQERHPDWPELGFVQVGDHLDYALKQVRRLGLPQVVIAGMIGKISKLAQGRLQTHISEGGVDFDFLAEAAGQLGADAKLQERLRTANTARHVQILLRQADLSGLEAWLAQTAADQAFDFLDGVVPVEVLLYDIRGELLAVGSRE